MRLILRLVGALLAMGGLVLLVYYAAIFETGVELPRAEFFGHRVGGGRLHDAALTSERNRGLVVGGLMAVLGGGLLVLLRKTSDPGQRACPYCAETIKSTAVVCRFCQRELPPATG